MIKDKQLGTLYIGICRDTIYLQYHSLPYQEKEDISHVHAGFLDYLLSIIDTVSKEIFYSTCIQPTRKQK